MTIEKRLERIEAILDARGLDWDHPRVASDHFADASKMVAEEPAKKPEPEHFAGPMPDPGKGYRILSKDPLDDLQPGDEFWSHLKGGWWLSDNARVCREQELNFWYRRKIETPEPEPEYREPVLPADCFMGCEFSDKCEKWESGCLAGWSFKNGWIANNGVCWAHARIKKDA